MSHPIDRHFKKLCQSQYLVIAVVPDGKRGLPVQYLVTTKPCDENDIYEVLYPLVVSGRTFKVLELKNSSLASEGWANKTKDIFSAKKEDSEREEYERLKNKFEND